MSYKFYKKYKPKHICMKYMIMADTLPAYIMLMCGCTIFLSTIF